MNNTTLLNSQADQDWQYGMLEDAYKAYHQIREQSWHAAFQLAWIDSAFGEVDIQPVIAIHPSEFSSSAQILMSYLIRRVSPTPEFIRLQGNHSTWDIRYLRQQTQAMDSAWWIEKAKQAEIAGLFGVAMACWREAEDLSMDDFFDPPSRMQLLPLKIETHLQALTSTGNDG